MTTKKLLTSLAFAICALSIFAQDGISVERISVINMGDGRLLHRDLKSEKPLEGQHRIIDGFRSIYTQAEFKGGLYHGTVQVYKNNKLTTEGTYVNGVKSGMFKDYHIDGKTVKFERKVVDGKVDGITKTYDQQGKLEHEKGYKNGVEHGIERRYRDGKMTADCNYADGKKHGRQVEYFISNRADYTKRSEFNMGVPVGDYSEELTDGVMRVKGKYKNGKKEGKWVHKRNDGILEKEITYKDDVQDGTTTTYYTDGTPEKISEYKQGKLDGVTKTFYWDTGKIKTEYTYKEGKKHGIYKLYYDKGTLREEGRCENNQEVYRKEFNQNGELRSIKERTRTGWETVQ